MDRDVFLARLRLLIRRTLPAFAVYCLLAGAAAASEHLVLGAEDEDDAFLLMPRQIAEGPDGNLYVFDAGDSFIKVFAPDGGHLRDLAGPGEGPGEIQRADGATFGFTPEGRLFFTEYYGGHRWLTVMELDGTLVDTIGPQLQTAWGIKGAAALPGDRFLVQFSYDTKAEHSGEVYLYRMPQALRIMDAEGALGPEIVRTDHIQLISTSPNGGTSNLPFTPSFAWAVAADGRVVWSDGLSPQLSVYGPDGQALEPLATPLPEAGEVTREELQRWQQERREMMMERNPQWWQRFGRAVEHYDEALYPRPVISSVAVTPAGNLLVTGRSEEDEPGIPYWLLDAEGKLLAECRAKVWELEISPRYLLYFTRHDDGQRLVNVLVREADEAEALAQIETMSLPSGVHDP